MVDFSKPVELSFVFLTIAMILLVIGVGVFLVKRYKP